MTARHTLLVLDDDQLLCRVVHDRFSSGTLEVAVAHSAAEGLAACEARTIDVVVLDEKLPDGEGHALCSRILAVPADKSIRPKHPEPQRVQRVRSKGVRTLLWTVFGTIRSLFRTRRELALENLALRQQVGVLLRTRRGRRLRLGVWDRAFWVILSQRWGRWREVLAIVEPATVIRWHRNAFRRFWKRRS